MLAQADEFRDIRLKSGEKALYKEINKANAMRFPIQVDIALAAHKTSLLIQAELGGVEFPADDLFQTHKVQYQLDKGMIFQHIHRLTRCVIDCQIYLQDSVAVRHGLELARSLAARVWDNSPLQLKQINQIGIVAVRKLAAVGINSIEALDNTEAHRLEMIMSKNPPWGSKILASLKDFPKLRVSVKMMGKVIFGCKLISWYELTCIRMSKPDDPSKSRSRPRWASSTTKSQLFFTGSQSMCASLQRPQTGI